MKKTSIIFALACVLGTILPFSSVKAKRVQYWAKGVSVDGGWYNRVSGFFRLVTPYVRNKVLPACT